MQPESLFRTPTALVLVGPRLRSWAAASCRAGGFAVSRPGAFPPGSKSVILMDLEALHRVLGDGYQALLTSPGGAPVLVLMDNDCGGSLAFALSCGAIGIPTSDLHLLPMLLTRLSGAIDESVRSTHTSSRRVSFCPHRSARRGATPASYQHPSALLAASLLASDPAAAAQAHAGRTQPTAASSTNGSL